MKKQRNKVNKIKHVVSTYIDYDKTIPISAVSENVLSFLPLEKLLENFRIVTDSKQKWLEDLNLDATITYLFKKSKRQNIPVVEMLRSEQFLDYVNISAKPDRKYLLYNPLNPPYKVNPLYYIMNSPTMAHAYENKRYFRDEFSDVVKIPRYKIILLSNLIEKSVYTKLKKEFGSFVLQEEDSTGSRGTFIVSDEKEFKAALEVLQRVADSRTVVVSKMVKGESVGTQVCITKYGSFSSGIQRMVIGSKTLANLSLAGTSGFGGGEVGVSYSSKVNAQVGEITQVIAERLYSHGYKGIFGIDLIITPEEEVYAIEVNARMTAFTHIIADMQLMDNQIPFILLHVLELGGYKYEVKNFQALPSRMNVSSPVSYLIMYNKCDHDFRMPAYVRPGVYMVDDGKVKFMRSGHSVTELKDSKEILIFSKYKKGADIARGDRVYTVTFNGKSMKGEGLNRRSATLIRTINSHFGIDFKAATEHYYSPFSKVADTVKDVIMHPLEEVDKAARKVKEKVAEVIEDTFESK